MLPFLPLISLLLLLLVLLSQQRRIFLVILLLLLLLLSLGLRLLLFPLLLLLCLLLLLLLPLVLRQIHCQPPRYLHQPHAIENCLKLFFCKSGCGKITCAVQPQLDVEAAPYIQQQKRDQTGD